MAYKKTNKTNGKRGYKSRIPRTIRTDSNRFLINAIFYAKKATHAVNNTAMNYSIALNPKGPTLIGGTGVTFHKGDLTQSQLQGPTIVLSLPKFSSGHTLAAGGTINSGLIGQYNQYRVNGCQIKVRTGDSCGLVNKMYMANDTGTSGIIDDPETAVSGAHKEFSLTESRREAKYKLKFTGQDKDYRTTDSAQVLDASLIKYAKVFQMLPAMPLIDDANQICVHQVEVMFDITCKDTKNLN